ncbi:MAG: hypothetical protein IH899_11345 [Planctomycetes bacterium]|nr:hypothetical protein [Planctomycetota bacterium]
MHPDKTHIVDATEGSFDFLGDTFKREYRFPREKSLRKLKDAVRQKTKRANERAQSSNDYHSAQLNPTLRGWFVSFQHGQPATYPSLDGWIRMRLRSILRKRQKRKGRGQDHHRWPNAYFAERGLFSLKQAHASASQSSVRKNH